MMEQKTEQATETPERRVMRQWFQGKLGERLLQAAQMAKDRAMLRRGARKQQDGMLGKPGTSSESEASENMQIRVGDEIHHHHGYMGNGDSSPTGQVAKTGLSARAKTALVALAIMLAGTVLPGIGALAAWMGGAFDKPPKSAEFSDSDTFPGVVIQRPESLEPPPNPE